VRFQFKRHPLPLRLRAIPAIAVLLLCNGAFAEQDRIAGPISNMRLVLAGNRSRKAQPQYDEGRVDPDLRISRVTVSFRLTNAQQADLTELVSQQQDRASTQYHRWLTPEQYADRFGLSQRDMDRISAWLSAKSLNVVYTGRGRNRITFSGRARDLEGALGTEIHRYRIEGETYFANSTDLSIPVELADVVLAVRGLDNFPIKSRLLPAVSPQPEETLANGTRALQPGDLATIYDIAPLYATGVTGSGQRIAVTGQSDISLSDIAAFRSNARLPVNVPSIVLVPGSPDPGITGSEAEADLDVEWAGAIARNATVIYVNSMNVIDSFEYAISENLAPVLSTSFAFGPCEQDQPLASNLAIEEEALQANAQGITLLFASGDSGAAGCDSPGSAQAIYGPGVSFPASLPEVTAVGGARFNDATGLYWNLSNSTTGASAISYMPEIAWNEIQYGLYASGGGMSLLFPKPQWQAGPGVPNDGARDVPDLALAASPFHDPYTVVINGAVKYVGGTSAATPVFAGIIALLNQYYDSKGEGNINPNLYRISQTNAFHDIVSGNNIVPCNSGTPGCTAGSFGYAAGMGYDLVTGLGSVDAYHLIANWNAPTPASDIVPACNASPATAAVTGWPCTITLTETAGVATNLTGFSVNGNDFSAKIAGYFGTSVIAARSTITASLDLTTFAAVPAPVQFIFSGVDAGGRAWSQQLSVPVQRIGDRRFGGFRH
jgi:subtilase family serine protease